MHTWLLLHYKMPRETSASRVYVWRKLKRMGAVLLHDAIWILPSNTRTQEQFQWLAAEISELEGKAMLWKSNLLLNNQQEEELVQQFLAQVAGDYSLVLAQLELEQADRGAGSKLAELASRYHQIKRADYFQSELGKQVQQALLTFNDKEERVEEVVGHRPAGKKEGEDEL